MQSDDITKLGKMLGRMKGYADVDEYRTVVLHNTRRVFLYSRADKQPSRALGFTQQDLEYLAEQNEEAKHIIVKLILNGDLK